MGCSAYKYKSRRRVGCPVMDWDVLFTNINHVDGWNVLFTNISPVDRWDVLLTNINHVDRWHVLLWIGISYLQT